MLVSIVGQCILGGVEFWPLLERLSESGLRFDVFKLGIRLWLFREIQLKRAASADRDRRQW